MEARLAQQVIEINRLSMTRYIESMGYEPIAQRPGSTDYVLVHEEPFTVTIDHATNRFTDNETDAEGSLVDLIRRLYRCTWQDLVRAPLEYGLGPVLAAA